jgi:hypothetical protein
MYNEEQLDAYKEQPHRSWGTKLFVMRNIMDHMWKQSYRMRGIKPFVMWNDLKHIWTTPL